ncbi:hypothetical protein G3545_27385 [Starkeya sp. ORNL1]|uniref:hypothetical protein n=1 Tax=Starkeya sp. ORNL1 TaxID=2709380 RepID=UPI0014640970|nr:hypothetical protein [Starkeya sp. ORNL1]QJP17042.1 hypothetical protein G3545_27385 [Starkeya sp. ORNL1]
MARFPLLSRLLLVLALLALGGELAAPAFATALSAGRDMPCHEQMRTPLHAADGPVAARGEHRHGTAPQPAVGHLCCALACLVIAPAGEGPILSPARSVAAWDGPAASALTGLALPIPVPPPRTIS